MFTFFYENVKKKRKICIPYSLYQTPPPYLRQKSEIFGVTRYKHPPPVDKTKISQQSVKKNREKFMKVDFTILCHVTVVF